MGKKPQKCLKNCEKHHFIMKPVQYFAYISRDVEVSFCPPSLKHHPIFPLFNKDKKHYTSSFCLKEDQAKYQTNDEIYKKEHQKFCMEQANGKSQMLEPKPRTKVSYCHVCKDHYEDYSEHIKARAHKTCVRLNKFSLYIGELIKDKYSDKQPAQPILNMNQEESEINEKQLNSNSTLPGCSSIEEPRANQGFTLVSGQGAFESHGFKLNKFKSEGALGENLTVKQVMSPQFENLLRRCSTTQLGSQKKSTSMTKFPIIISPIE